LNQSAKNRLSASKNGTAAARPECALRSHSAAQLITPEVDGRRGDHYWQLSTHSCH